MISREREREKRKIEEIGSDIQREIDVEREMQKDRRDRE